MCKNRKILLIVLFGTLSACSQSTWTEGFEYYGFKDGYETHVSYDGGGYTKLTINVSSEMYQELNYPLTFNVYLNTNICATKTLNKPTGKLLFTASCEQNLGPGKHKFKAMINSPNNFKNISTEKDRENNHYHGSITYTLEK